MTKRDFIRYSFVFLTFLGVFSTYPKAAYQARAEEPAGDVIYISTPQEFQDINLDLTAHYEIVNNIDFTGFSISPIAVNNDFTGIINGNNYKILNIKLSVPNNFGSGYYGGNQEYSLALIVNNSGTIKNLVLENIYFANNQNGLIKLKTLDLNYRYSLNFSLFIKKNNVSGVVDNVVFNIYNLNLLIGSENFSSYYEQYYKIDFKVSLFVESNFGQILNSRLNYFGNSHISINGGYRRITLIEFSMIDLNHSIIENIRLFYGGHLYIENGENASGSNWYYEGKVIYSSLFVRSNQGSIRDILLYSEVYLGLTVYDARNLAIYFSLFSNYSSYSVISNVRIINNSKFNFSIDHRGFADTFLITYDLFASVIEFSTITDVLIENNESLILDIKWRSNSPSAVSISQLGAIQSQSEVKKIIITGKPMYEFIPQNTLYWFTLYVSLSNTSLGDAILDFLLINLTPVLLIDSYDQTLINSFISNKTNFMVSSPQYLNNLNVFSYVEYLFLASKLPNPESTIVGIDDSLFGIWDKTNLNYYKQDTSYKSSIFQINELLIELDLNSNWIIYQLSIDGFPILSFSAIDFPLSNGDTVNINYDFTFNESVNVINNNIVLESGTHFLYNLGTYEFLINDTYSYNKLIITTTNTLISSYNAKAFNSNFIPILTGSLSSKLNGQTYLGTPITTPGLHTLVIYGENGYEQEITFTIILETDGVTDEITYTESVTPTFSGGTATLNGEAFESGTEITDVGEYTLLITGVNGFIEEINFTIAPIVTGLQNGVTKDPGFIPNITGEGIILELNEEPYTIGEPITTPGLHTLVIYGENGYEQEITFIIALVFNGISNNQSIIDNEVTLTFSGGIAELNGVVIESGFKTDKLGNYQLLITGVNDEIILNYNFRILPNVQGLNNLVYLGNVNPNISGNYSSMTLNGFPYSGTNITIPGDHELIIYGHSLDENNQFEILFLKNFRVNVDVRNVTDEANYVNQSKNIIISGGIATLNSQPIGLNHTATSIGHYTLVITGTNDYRFEINFTISPEINGVEEGQAYTSSTDIQILGSDAQLILNGMPITNGVLTQPGQHELVINGVGGFEVRRSFNIIATITGVTNNAEYLNDSRTITFSGGQATLNGQAIESGYVLDRIGNFELEISGVKDYKLIYTFTNLPNVSGVSEGVSYNGFTNIEIIGNGVNLTMNGESFSNGNYSQPGLHEFHIIAAGDYLQVINFTIIPIVSGGVIAGQQYVNSTVNMIISGGNPTLNGAPISLVFSVNEVGNYHLVVPQTNLPNFELIFYIIPDISRLQDNRTYNGSVTPTILGEGMDLTLNNKSYVSGTRITNPGQNTIRITSANGEYLKVVNFTITLQFSGLADGVTYYDVLTPSFSGGVVTLNGEPFLTNTEITTYGEFELIIIGDNNFLRSYEFTILPYNMSFPQDGASRDEVDLKIFRVHSLTEITLNDVDISQTRLIQGVGHYDLVITFDGNVISDTRFTVEPQDYVQDGSEFTSPISIHHPFATVKINGREVNQSYRVDIQRQYTVEVFGVNDYYHTYSFSFINENLESYQQLIAPMIITAIGSLAVFFIRKRWVS